MNIDGILLCSYMLVQEVGDLLALGNTWVGMGWRLFAGHPLLLMSVMYCPHASWKFSIFVWIGYPFNKIGGFLVDMGDGASVMGNIPLAANFGS